LNRLSSHNHHGIIKMMVLLLFIQTLLPLQTHTRVARTDSGRLVVLCTLQGIQKVQLDDQGRIIEKGFHATTHSSAAVKFSQLLGSASPSLPTLILAHPTLRDTAPNTRSDTFIPTHPYPHFSIRAPPTSVIL